MLSKHSGHMLNKMIYLNKLQLFFTIKFNLDGEMLWIKESIWTQNNYLNSCLAP